MTDRADLMTEFPGHTHTLVATALVRHLMANLTTIRNVQRLISRNILTCFG